MLQKNKLLCQLIITIFEETTMITAQEMKAKLPKLVDDRSHTPSPLLGGVTTNILSAYTREKERDIFKGLQPILPSKDLKQLTKLGSPLSQDYTLLPKDLNAKDLLGRTPLMRAILQKDFDKINRLIAHPKVLIGERDDYGKTAFFYARKLRLHDVKQQLLKKRDCIKETAQKSQKALFNAILEKDIKSATELLLRNKDVTAYLVHTKRNTDDATFLHVAAEHNRPEIAKLLFQSGADINAINKNGCTPLHLANYWVSMHNGAAYLGPQGVIRVLLHSGARIGIQNNHGFTADILSVAVRKKQGKNKSRKRKLSPTSLPLQESRSTGKQKRGLLALPVFTNASPPAAAHVLRARPLARGLAPAPKRRKLNPR